MTTQATSNNPFKNVLQFYSDQAEKITPVIKQGIGDWFTVYGKIWSEGMRVQGGLLQKLTGNKESAAYSEQAKKLGDKIIGIQKEISTGLVNIGLKGIQSIIEASKKSDTEDK